MKRYIFFLCVIVVASMVLADDVYLKDGRVLKGKVVEHETRIELKMGIGSIFIDRKDITKITSKRPPSEIFAERFAMIEDRDFESWQELARWCKKNLPYKYKSVVEKAKQAQLEQKIYEAGEDPEKIYGVFLWAHQQRYPGTMTKTILERVIQANPDHVEARKYLGQVRYQGTWMAKEEAQKLKERDFAIKMRELGLVFYKGNWVRPEEAKWNEELDALRAQNEALVQQRDEALRRAEAAVAEREKLISDNQQLARDIDRLSQELRYLENFRADVARSVDLLRRLLRDLEIIISRPPYDLDRVYIPFLGRIRNAVRRIRGAVDDIGRK